MLKWILSVVVAVALVVGALFFWRRHRRRRGASTALPAAPQMMPPQVAQNLVAAGQPQVAAVPAPQLSKAMLAFQRKFPGTPVPADLNDKGLEALVKVGNLSALPMLRKSFVFKKGKGIGERINNAGKALVKQAAKQGYQWARAQADSYTAGAATQIANQAGVPKG